MAWRKIAKEQLPATPATSPSVSESGSVSDAEPSSKIDTSAPWPLDIHSMSPTDVMFEVIDHLKRLRAEVATMRAELDESKEAQVQAHEGSRGETDMTGFADKLTKGTDVRE